jgi:hypothetical protein
MVNTTNLKMVIHNSETNEYTERDYTEAEVAEHLAAQAEIVATQQKAADKAALLERLGLTEDELKTILG